MSRSIVRAVPGAALYYRDCEVCWRSSSPSVQSVPWLLRAGRLASLCESSERWASEQLALAKRSLATIAVEAGFCDQSHFNRTFQRFTGMAPGQYRSTLRGANSVQFEATVQYTNRPRPYSCCI